MAAPKKPAPRARPSLKTVEVDPVEDLLLDAANPRLDEDEKNLGQARLIEAMVSRFRVEDVAESILATGYKPFDPLIAYEKGNKYIVREGNRRTTALKLLLKPELAPQTARAAWQARAEHVSPELRRDISKVLITVVDGPTAEDVEAYMGFRHVTGVLQWPPQEKAKFIAHLIDEHEWSYQQIAERLGSYARHIEKLYVAYRALKQAAADGIDGSSEVTIGVLLRALQTADIREFLGVEYPDDPRSSKKPVPQAKSDEFQEFVKWTFGTSEKPPLLNDSRDLTKLGKILRSSEALRYLRSAERPVFERAWFKSGGQQESLVESLQAAADRLEEAAAFTPQHASDTPDDIFAALERCALYFGQILRDYPELKKKHFGKA